MSIYVFILKKNDYNIQLDLFDMVFIFICRIKRNKDISKYLFLYVYVFLFLIFKVVKQYISKLWYRMVYGDVVNC